MAMTVLVCAMCLVSFVFGIFLEKYVRKIDGIMYIDTRDEEKDIYNLEIHTPMVELPNKRHIFLKVSKLEELRK